MDISQLLQELSSDLMIAATLSSPSSSLSDTPEKIVVRQVVIKDQPMFQVSSYVESKVFHRNLTWTDCLSFLKKQLPLYKQAIIKSEKTTYHVLIGKKGVVKVLKKAVPSEEINKLSVTHNRKKNYILEEGAPISFLVKLGIMNAEGKVFPKKYDKFRQINRFLESVRDAVSGLLQQNREQAISIVDFGCGKAYLTFAVYYYLTEIEKHKVSMVGIDLKADLVALCQNLADHQGYYGMQFLAQDIRYYDREDPVDLVISLHACDTATDAVLLKAVEWQAKVILSVPCCQHELLSQVKCDPMDSLLRHPLLKERFAALVTDAARAEWLTMQGYDVDISEFIDFEHTPKNMLIRAMKREKGGMSESKARERYSAFRDLLHAVPSAQLRDCSFERSLFEPKFSS